MSGGSRRAYLLRELAELVFFVAILAAISQFVPLPIWIWLGVPFGKILFASAMYLLFFRRILLRRSRVGPEALVGQTAETLTPLNPSGQIKVNGEIWSARSHSGAMIPERQKVEILRVEGNIAHVVNVG
jgi:membrane protein implicated in regulation of membrane protease activity